MSPILHYHDIIIQRRISTCNKQNNAINAKKKRSISFVPSGCLFTTCKLWSQQLSCHFEDAIVSDIHKDLFKTHNMCSCLLFVMAIAVKYMSIKLLKLWDTSYLLHILENDLRSCSTAFCSSMLSNLIRWEAIASHDSIASCLDTLVSTLR